MPLVATKMGGDYHTQRREVSQTKEDKYHMVSFICGI